jgi:O-acetyl-ADP-ribose deacetylase (regulator of RNase III)
MKFLLRDQNVNIVEAWNEEFSNAPDVNVSHGDIFELTADAIVSPANSFGFMDGGIDFVYSQRFGWDLQTRLQDLLRVEHDGELLVGQAVVVPTGAADIPFLISAPTMRVPTDVSTTVNAYLAFRAAIRAATQHNRISGTKIETILCPGLGTAVGRMVPKVCARQMHCAYDNFRFGRSRDPLNLAQAMIIHCAMTA